MLDCELVDLVPRHSLTFVAKSNPLLFKNNIVL